MGVLTREMAPEQAIEALRSAPDYASQQLAQSVSTAAPYERTAVAQASTLRVALLDCGVKRSIIRFLNANGCDVTVLPLSASSDEISALKPDGVLLSPGPGDPVHLGTMEDTLKSLLGTVPIMAICLGHQSVARALGGSTFKLKFGHHGGNHPVKDIETGKVTITTQNHGYAVDDSALPPGLQVSQYNLNDGTVEGLTHRDYPLLSIQYHAEGSPGPQDSNYLFERFVAMMRA